MSSYKSLLDRALGENELSIDDSIEVDTLRFLELLTKWNQTINLTAHRLPEDLIYKDIIDTLLTLKRSELSSEKEKIMDMGAGAGFIGILILLLFKEKEVIFLESDRKKVNFIKQVCRELHLISRAQFLQIRAEALPAEQEGSVHRTFSRATWPLEQYRLYAHYYVQNHGHIHWMGGKEALDLSGDKFKKDIRSYVIKPYNFERHLFILPVSK